MGAADERGRANAARRERWRRVVTDGDQSEAADGVCRQSASTDDLPCRRVAVSGRQQAVAWWRVQGDSERAAVGPARRGQYRYRQGRVGRENAAAADRWRARDGGRSRVQR